MKDEQHRFNDQNKIGVDYHTEVFVVCRICSKKAMASVDYALKKARLLCSSCGYTKEITTVTTVSGIVGDLQVAAHHYFNAELWLSHPFKNDLFWAYNYRHLDYLQSYIAATLREHKDRTHFTLLEKLPKFYHEAKNRDALLKIIEKLKRK